MGAARPAKGAGFPEWGKKELRRKRSSPLPPAPADAVVRQGRARPAPKTVIRAMDTAAVPAAGAPQIPARHGAGCLWLYAGSPIGARAHHLVRDADCGAATSVASRPDRIDDEDRGG